MRKLQTTEKIACSLQTGGYFQGRNGAECKLGNIFHFLQLVSSPVICMGKRRKPRLCLPINGAPSFKVTLPHPYRFVSDYVLKEGERKWQALRGNLKGSVHPYRAPLFDSIKCARITSSGTGANIAFPLNPIKSAPTGSPH